MNKPKIKITLVDRIGKLGCHRGHKIGDTFDYDTERGKLYPMAMHVAFPYIDILRYGGTPPTSSNGEVRFCCPDADVINVFRLDVITDSDGQHIDNYLCVCYHIDNLRWEESIWTREA